MRIEHFRLRNLGDAPKAPAGAGRDPVEVIHLVGLAETSGSSRKAPAGQVIVASGETATVVGEDWLSAFLGAVLAAARAAVRRTPMSAVLKFSTGCLVTAEEEAVLPLRMGTTRVLVRALVLPGGLPMLLSRRTLTSLGAVIDFAEHTLSTPTLFLPLILSAAGHHTFNALGSWGPEHQKPSALVGVAATVADSPQRSSPRVEAAMPAPPSPPRGAGAAGRLPPSSSPILTEGTPELSGLVRKLHIQCSHASADRICAVLRTQGVRDSAVIRAVRDSVASCAICRRHSPAPTHAAVTLPTATSFNEVVAVDLFFLAGTPPVPVLHVICFFSRLSQCFLLAGKSAIEVGNAFLSWIVLFDAPHRLRADDRGDFSNGLWRLIGDHFGVHLDATAAQAPWSNGVCERHNATVKQTFMKLAAAEPGAATQLLLDMACLAKNSLLVHGSATPYQLMCGSRPRLPSAVSDAPPGLSAVSCPGDDALQQTLRLLGASRVALVQAGADQSLPRALLRKMRSPGVERWAADSSVYYWHTGVSLGTSGWRGPAVVGGQTGRQVLLRHGGQWLTRDTGAVMSACASPAGLASEVPSVPATPQLNPSTATPEPLLGDDGDDDVPDLASADWEEDAAPTPAVDAAAVASMWAGIMAALESIE